MAHLQKNYPYVEGDAPNYINALIGYLKRYHHKDLEELLLKEDGSLHYSIEVPYGTLIILFMFFL